MLTGHIRPSTIEGVKSLAAQLRKEKGIKHSHALDLAAKQADYANFKHARNALPERGTGAGEPYVLLTIYWSDHKKGYKAGRETLKVPLAKPILDHATKFELKKLRGFGDLRMVAPDHLVCDTIAESQDVARGRICTAARSLRFMEHTGLRPTREWRRAYPKGQIDDKLPYNDHSTDWVDPESGQFILVDEPYSKSANEAKRTAWAKRTGWKVAKTSWPGMYFPYNCDLYVATDGTAGYDLEALVAKINAIPAPLLAENWAGDSSPSWETFASPMATTPQDMRRSRSRGTVYPVPSKASVPYGYGTGNVRRRPAAAMPIPGHTEAGRIIKAVLRSCHRVRGVGSRMGSVRSTLEDWLALEIARGDLPGPEFFDVYYGEPESSCPFLAKTKTRAGLLEVLAELKNKLESAYPDCEPLRRQVRRIDKSMSAIGKTRCLKD